MTNKTYTEIELRDIRAEAWDQGWLACRDRIYETTPYSYARENNPYDKAEALDA